MIAVSTARNYRYNPNDPVIERAIKERGCTQLQANSFQHHPDTETYYNHYFLTTKEFQENLSHMALEKYNTYLTSTAFHADEDKIMADLISTNNNGFFGTIVIGIGVAGFAALAWPAMAVSAAGVALLAGTVALGTLLAGDVISIDSIYSTLLKVKDGPTQFVLKGAMELLSGLEKERLAEESKKEVEERRLKDIEERIKGLKAANAAVKLDLESQKTAIQTAIQTANTNLHAVKDKEIEASKTIKAKIEDLHKEAVEKDKEEDAKKKIERKKIQQS
jgi:hypothetical protein